MFFCKKKYYRVLQLKNKDRAFLSSSRLELLQWATRVLGTALFTRSRLPPVSLYYSAKREELLSQTAIKNAKTKTPVRVFIPRVLYLIWLVLPRWVSQRGYVGFPSQSGGLLWRRFGSKKTRVLVLPDGEKVWWYVQQCSSQCQCPDSAELTIEIGIHSQIAFTGTDG